MPAAEKKSQVKVRFKISIAYLLNSEKISRNRGGFHRCLFLRLTTSHKLRHRGI